MGLGLGLGINIGGGSNQSIQGILGASLLLNLDSRAGASAASITDQASGNTATAVGSPVYSSSGGVNGLPKVTLSAGNYYQGASNVWAAGASRTLYLVIKRAAADGNGAVFCNRKTAPDWAPRFENATGACDVLGDESVTNYTVPLANLDANLNLLVYKWQSGTSGITFIKNGAPLVVSPTTAMVTESGTVGYFLGHAGAGGNCTADFYLALGVAGITSSTQDAHIRAIAQGVWGTP